MAKTAINFGQNHLEMRLSKIGAMLANAATLSSEALLHAERAVKTCGEANAILAEAQNEISELYISLPEDSAR